jgi:hypothetical protein
MSRPLGWSWACHIAHHGPLQTFSFPQPLPTAAHSCAFDKGEKHERRGAGSGLVRFGSCLALESEMNLLRVSAKMKRSRSGSSTRSKWPGQGQGLLETWTPVSCKKWSLEQENESKPSIRVDSAQVSWTHLNERGSTF